ncbi:MAG TPA: adenylosuccinate lyase family protein [Solirubrobacterales bacterium]|jgi:adenylosuccinate lyase/3-carboxy-cis,cis-muconate cycloisomerase
MGSGLDDDLLGGFFADRRQRQIFSGRGRLQSWLDVEAALARAQADLGLVPAEAAARIAACCDASAYDLAALGEEASALQHPVVAVVRALEHAVGERWSRFVHHGATSQDIADSGQALQLRAGLDALEPDLEAAQRAAAELAHRHRETLAAGRTRGQHAVPITFGLKAASWADELSRLRARLAEARPRLLALQISGAAGTLAAYGPRWRELRAAVARELGLSEPSQPWHVSRDRIGELAALMSLLAGAMERVGAEVVRLQSTDLAEVAERPAPGHVGSSTMPQKRNPQQAEGLVAKARLIHGPAGVLLRNGAHQHERDVGAWMVEWIAVPELFLLGGAGAAELRELLEGLEVDPEQMLENLGRSEGAIVAEAVMMALDERLGRDRAHHLLAELAAESRRTGRPFAAVVAADPQVGEVLSPSELRDALNPRRWIGAAAELSDLAAGADLPPEPQPPAST